MFECSHGLPVNVWCGECDGPERPARELELWHFLAVVRVLEKSLSTNEYNDIFKDDPLCEIKTPYHNTIEYHWTNGRKYRLTFSEIL